MKIFYTAVILSLCLNCYAGNNTIYKDGMYTGSHSFVNVEITIENNKISNIDITGHGGGGKKYADLISPMAKEVIKAQSTDIDAITGATVSSRNFIDAVNNALKKAAIN